jgi:hypothetical protein
MVLNFNKLIQKKNKIVCWPNFPDHVVLCSKKCEMANLLLACLVYAAFVQSTCEEVPITASSTQSGFSTTNHSSPSASTFSVFDFIAQTKTIAFAAKAGQVQPSRIFAPVTSEFSSFVELDASIFESLNSTSDDGGRKASAMDIAATAGTGIRARMTTAMLNTEVMTVEAKLGAELATHLGMRLGTEATTRVGTSLINLYQLIAQFFIRYFFFFFFLTQPLFIEISSNA